MQKKKEPAKAGDRTDKIDVLTGETCPICMKKTLTLSESEMEVPYFGKTYIFSMDCSDCKYHKADVECSEQKEPVKYVFEIQKEKDMHVRVIKSSNATIKIPHIATVTPGPASNGYITNVEGILNRIKKNIETARDAEEDTNAKKKAKKLLKKLTRAAWGQEKLKMIIEDPSGNSAIIDERAEVSKLKVK